MNFRIYWRNNVYDELLDGNNITYYTATSSATVYITGSNTMANYNTATCNSTKNTPNLSGDIFVSPLNDGRRAMDKELGWFHACSAYPTSDLRIKIPII